MPQIGSLALKSIDRFDNAWIVTYQHILSLLNEGFPWLTTWPQIVGNGNWFVVFDEAHFFCSDSIFYHNTTEILQRLVSTFSNATRIYMTATPDEVKPLIAHVEYLFSKSTHSDVPVIDSLRSTREIREFVFPVSYDYLTIKFFREWSTLTGEIEKNADEKWLIFVGSKDAGKALKRNLGKKAEYMDSETKAEESRAFYQLARTSKFPHQVLIATSVLDNGVNIEDPAVKNVVIDSISEVQMKQMLGRKRTSPGEKVTLYVKIATTQDITRQYNHYESSYRFLQSFREDPQGNIIKLWGTLSPDMQKLLVPSYKYGQLVFIPNQFAEYYLGIMLQHCEMLLDTIKYDEQFGFSKTVLEWFTNATYQLDPLDNTPALQVIEKNRELLVPYSKKENNSPDEIKELHNKLISFEEALHSCGLRPPTIRGGKEGEKKI